MHKSFLVAAILVITLVCTACVNKFAVQELNNNAKELLAQGKTEAAIARLESSIDLDNTVYETHYNLAVAYIQAKMFDKALGTLEKVKELKPDFADTYHSIAVCNEEKAYEIISKVNKNNSNSEMQDTDAEPTKNNLTEEDKEKISEYITTAIDNYNTYLTKKDKAEDKDSVQQKIQELNNKLRQYSGNDTETDENKEN